MVTFPVLLFQMNIYLQAKMQRTTLGCNLCKFSVNISHYVVISITFYICSFYFIDRVQNTLSLWTTTCTKQTFFNIIYLVNGNNRVWMPSWIGRSAKGEQPTTLISSLRWPSSKSFSSLGCRAWSFPGWRFQCGFGLLAEIRAIALFHYKLLETQNRTKSLGLAQFSCWRDSKWCRRPNNCCKTFYMKDFFLSRQTHMNWNKINENVLWIIWRPKISSNSDFSNMSPSSEQSFSYKTQMTLLSGWIPLAEKCPAWSFCAFQTLPVGTQPTHAGYLLPKGFDDPRYLI